MTKKIFFGSLFGAVLLLGAGCAKQNAGVGVDPGTDNCSSEFISDYGTVNRAVGFSTDNVANAENLVGQFEAKYRGVNCKAEVTRGNQLQSTVESISADQLVRDWRAAIAQSRRG